MTVKPRKRRKPVPGRKPGHPPHKPTEQNRRTVKVMIAGGLKHDQVCAAIGISGETLRTHYRHEIDVAEPEAFAMVAQSLFMNAVGGPERDWTKAHMTAAIFIAKTRMGWVEPDRNVNVTGSLATYDLSKLDEQALQKLRKLLAGVAIVGGDRRGAEETGSGETTRH